VNLCAPLQGDSLRRSEKHSPLHCVYGFEYGFPSQLLYQIWFKTLVTKRSF